MTIYLTYRLALSGFSYVCLANLIKSTVVVGGLFLFLKISWCGLEFPLYLHFLSRPGGKSSLHFCCSLVFSVVPLFYSLPPSNVYT